MTRLLRWFADPSLADEIAGDLAEERLRRAHRARVSAAIWFWRSLLSVVAYLALEKAVCALQVVTSACLGLGRGPEWRQSIRSLRRTPWYSLTVIGVIALTMALATTVFAIVDGVLFKPLPYGRPDQLYRVGGRRSTSPEARTGGFSGGQPVSFRDAADLAASVPGARLALYEGGFGAGGDRSGDLRTWAPETAAVDARFLDVLGVRPLMGGFADADFATPPDAPTPALVTYGVWRAQLAADPDAIGRALVAENELGQTLRFRVAGVLPAGFMFPGRIDGVNLLVPLRISAIDRADRRARRFSLLARLPPDMALLDIKARFDGVARAAAAELGGSSSTRPMGRPWDAIDMSTLEEFMGGTQRPVFIRVFGAALALVFLACVNISGLVVSRGIDRRRELALRRALGASGRRIAAGVLRENTWLIGAGTILGLAASRALLAVIGPLLPAELLKPAAIDWRVVGFVLLSSVAAVAFVSIWPARQASRQLATGALAGGTHGTARRPFGGQFVVVSVQVSIALVITTCGGLVAGSLLKIWRTDVGFETAHLSVLTVQFDGVAAADQRIVLTQFVRDVQRLPGVSAAGATTFTSMLRRGSPGGRFEASETYSVSRGFFAAAGLSLVDGRVLTDEELDQRAPLAVVSEEVSQHYFGRERAIGRPIASRNGSPPATIVGVVRETRLDGWDFQGDGGEVYEPIFRDIRGFSLLVRATGGASGVWPRIRELAATDARMRVTRAAVADDLLADTIRPRRFRTWLFGTMAVASIMMVGVGVLGLSAMSAVRRTREVGIRVALGATPRRVVRLFVREQVVAVILGVTAGMALSAWTVRLVQSYVYQTAIYDGRIWAIAVMTTFAAAVAGAIVPGWRASRIDPVTALRVD